MGLFQKKDSLVEHDEKAFGKWVKGLPEFKSLARLIGEFHSNNTLKAMWNKFSGMSGGKVRYSPSGKGDYEKMLKALLQHEINTVLNANYYIGSLYSQARANKFSMEMRRETMSPADFGARDDDSNVDKATSYIIFTSNSLKNTADNPGAAVTRNAIALALQNAAMYDVRSEATLRDLHRRLVDQSTLKPTRCMDKSAPYPSTGGAGYLLEHTFGLAKGLRLPAEESPAWFDLACFLLGGVIRSHGFTDGNGRVGRAAFAAAMLKGGLRFRALKVDAEKKVHGLSKVS